MSTKAAVAVTAATSVASTTWRQGRWTYLERRARPSVGWPAARATGPTTEEGRPGRRTHLPAPHQASSCSRLPPGVKG